MKSIPSVRLLHNTGMSLAWWLASYSSMASETRNPTIQLVKRLKYK